MVQHDIPGCLATSSGECREESDSGDLSADTEPPSAPESKGFGMLWDVY